MTMRMSLSVAVALLIAVSLTTGCRSAAEEPPRASATSPTTLAKPAPPVEPSPTPEDEAIETPAEPVDDEQPADDPEPPEEKPMVLIKTTKGDIKLELYPDAAPKTVANFLALIEDGYYDDMLWHRVAPGFVIQTGQGAGKSTIPDEVNEHKHGPGAVAMAKPGARTAGPRMSEPDSASTQWYICMRSAEGAAYLNQEYTVFGWATEGMDIVKQITQEDKVITIEVIDG